VRLRAEIADSSGHWVTILDEEVCCGAVHNGHTLSTVPAPAPPGGLTTTKPRPVLRLVEEPLTGPCPAPAVVAPDGSQGAATYPSDGMDVPGKGHFVGATVFLVYRSPAACRHFCFIQAVRRTISLDGRPSAASHPWRQDLERGQERHPPCYKYQSDRPEGGRIMHDSPGVVNPWGAMELPDGTTLRPRPGQRLVGDWEFRTWAVCLDPPTLYGQFTWRVHIDVPIPAGPPARGQKIPGATSRVDPPAFTPTAQLSPDDARLFDRMSR
jgi:hypothetical protein